MTNTESTMPCYCKLDTPCQPCLDAFLEEITADAFNMKAAALNDAPPTDDRDWTPEDEDDLAHDRKILDDMREEATNNPDMALALLNLYGEDTYSHEDYRRDVKADVKDNCPCNSCANDMKWYNA